MRGVVDPGPAAVSFPPRQGWRLEVRSCPVLEEAPLREGEPSRLTRSTRPWAGRAAVAGSPYAYVDVTPQVDVRPKQGKVVEVVLSVRLGPSCTFGPVTLHGLRSLPESLVRKGTLVPQRAGRPQPFSMSTLASARTRLFGLGVFSVVNVVPENESRPSTAEAPGRIACARSGPGGGGFRVCGPGSPRSGRRELSADAPGVALVEGGRYQAQVSADYSNANLLNRLVRLNWDNDIGYAVLPRTGWWMRTVGLRSRTTGV